MRPFILDISALTPTEYPVYTDYQRILTGSDTHANGLTCAALKAFVVDRLRVPLSTAENVFHLYHPPERLLPQHLFALFRLLAHERRSSSPLDLNMVFLPVEPLMIHPKPSSISVSQRNPSASPKATAARHLDKHPENTNPFRRRHVSQPHDRPPPLPPRKMSTTTPAPSLPPRRSRASSSSTLAPSSSNPTSISSPSALIRQSLQAAEKSPSGSSSTSSLHVIRQSTSPRASNGRKEPRAPRQIVDEVANALQQANVDAKPPSFKEVARDYVSRDQHIRLWSCRDILAEHHETPAQYAMIIVNQPIPNREIFRRAWRSSRRHYCADGGANRLYDLWDTDTRHHYLPTMIKGDLDSLRPDVRSYYESKGVIVLQDGDEYSTDLMKCISEVEKLEKEKQYPLLLIGGLSGRIDQTVHTMSLLHKLRQSRRSSFILSGESLAWILDIGTHLVDIDHDTMGQTCGILPVGVDSAMVTTKGLKWDLDWQTSFGGELSTSNHLLPDEPVVYIKTDRPILWCVEVAGATT